MRKKTRQGFLDFSDRAKKIIFRKFHFLLEAKLKTKRYFKITLANEIKKKAVAKTMVA